ncbi:hypothetical protein JCGZ_26672 [Jatropha curcas]|uniref:Leucine-rich repeat-containing N-terminal plant-type domain-containing protein n=1 Tax=Jatropha curcas TaxID=180498 RepID=A0A067LG62_JATCU|nr:hypothetical protein JCGZ_26672 [Jatropha curcas]
MRKQVASNRKNMGTLIQAFGDTLREIKIIKVCFGNEVTCIDKEREALVVFKQGLTDPSGRLSSWEGKDCCKWNGIKCNNQTGHVINLDLRNPYTLINGGVGDQETYERSCLGGKISPSFLELQYLSYLDISFNNFEGTQIPEFLGELKNLRYLNLSFSSFSGFIPSQLGNLSRLHYLDLYARSHSNAGAWELRADNLHWLSGLSSLKYLNMGYVKLQDVGHDWLQAINMLPSLLELNLQYCELDSIPLSLPSINFTSLSVLDLSENSFNSAIPQWLFNLTSLTRLYLVWNFFNGPIPCEFARLKSLEVLDLSNNLNIGGQIPSLLGNLTKLKILDLSANNLTGQIDEFLFGFKENLNNSLVSLNLNSNSLTGELPESLGVLKNLQKLQLSGNSFWGSLPKPIGKLSFLKELYLSSNRMNGTIPESFGQLSNLVNLDLEDNSWEGVLDETHLMNLTSLENIHLTTDSTRLLVFNVSYDWIPPFTLKYIQLVNCKVGPFFPKWLEVQTQLIQVRLNNVGISDTIPEEWFSKLSSQLVFLDLSNNHIKGKLPQKLESPNLQFIDLSYNALEGLIPLWTTNATELYLQSNSFSGPIPENIAVLMPRLQNLHLSDNHLNGTIPSSICKLEELRVFAVRNNGFRGELIDCWSNLQSLFIVEASNNSLSGSIPKSLGYAKSLTLLSLSNNDLDGEIPFSLQNCSSLSSIDLGGNRLSGNIPSWIGLNLSNILVLRLRSNLLDGQIPEEICYLPYLHFLDISNNKLSGIIPSCLGNLTAFVYGNSTHSEYQNAVRRLAYFKEQISVITKGREYEFSSNIALLNAIHLSENNLRGKIPEEITSLKALQVLNLSRNHISGSIPEKIGNLNLLETFDLSHNNLSGIVPPSLSKLTFMSHLDLSYNNLSGKIPTGNQLQTLNASSIYEGNPFLCGFPLQAQCHGDEIAKTVPLSSKDENESILAGFYVTIGPGFFVGFCGVLYVTFRRK